jgi:hypothetical protein
MSGVVMLAGCATGVASHSMPDAASPQHPSSDAPTDSSGSDTIAACAQPMSGALASWSFTGQPGSQASTAASMSAAGVTAQSVQRSPGVTSESGADSMNASNWATAGQPDQTRYFSLSIQPPSGCSLDITSLAIDAKASGTGPSHATLATSVDSFAQRVDLSTSSPSNLQLSVTHATGAVEVRMYGYSASAESGTLRLRNTLTITGSLH